MVEGDSAELSVRGHHIRVSAASPVRVPLSDQGPEVTGPMRSKTADRRPDGTLITASVPQPASGSRR